MAAHVQSHDDDEGLRQDGPAQLPERSQGLRGRHAAKQHQQGDQHEIEGDQGSGWEAGSRVASGQKWLENPKWAFNGKIITIGFNCHV